MLDFITSLNPLGGLEALDPSLIPLSQKLKDTITLYSSSLPFQWQIWTNPMHISSVLVKFFSILQYRE